MKLKLDENLGQRGAQLLVEAGHDIATVTQQELTAASDRELIAVCRKERRCLVTLDLDFANPLLFAPADYAGIAVLRLPTKSTPADLWDSISTLIAMLEQSSVEGRLWIVQPGRIREYESREDESGDSP